MVCSWSLYCRNVINGNQALFGAFHVAKVRRLLHSIQKGWSLGITENIQKVPNFHYSLTATTLDYDVRSEKIQKKKILANYIKM